MEALILDNSISDLKLYTLSLIKTSIRLWELPEIKIDRQTYFTQNDVESWKLKTWHVITKKVLNHMTSSQTVASTIVPELKDAIVNTGIKIFNWVLFVKMELGLDVCYAEEIIWTPLGFVDKQETFKSIWANDLSLYEGSPDKPIFRIACLLAQVDFVERHKDEMIEELNSRNSVDFDAINYPNKVYGIISTYICYHVNDFVQRMEQKSSVNITNHYLEFFLGRHVATLAELSEYDFADTIKVIDDLEIALHKGSILPPEKMIKLCALSCLIHGFEYYYRKFNSSQKKNIIDTIRDYGIERWKYRREEYMEGEFRQILLIIEKFEPSLSANEHISCFYHFENVLYYFPLESIICPRLEVFMKYARFNEYLFKVVRVTFRCLISDHFSHSPIRRNVYQELLKKVWKKISRSENDATKKELMEEFIVPYVHIKDFTSFKTLLKSYECDENNVQRYYRSACLNGEKLDELDSSKAAIIKPLLNEMFEMSEDRDNFLKEELYNCRSFKRGKFELLEKRFRTLDITQKSIRELIDPMESLYRLARLVKLNRCDKFIKWWHESSEDQIDLKNNFISSSYPSQCFYKCWLDENSFNVTDRIKSAENLLRWLFDSAESRIEFKKEKLSVLGLLNAGLNRYNGSLFNCYSNKSHSELLDFIKFCEIPPEKVNDVKEELRLKLEDLILNHVCIQNIVTFNFLIDWVTMSNEEFKPILQKLYDSSQLFKLCQNAIYRYHEFKPDVKGVFILYNIWLKLSGKLSSIKSDLICWCKGNRHESFIKNLSQMYEKLERGKVLTKSDLVFDGLIDLYE